MALKFLQNNKRRKASKKGLPPETLVFTGDKKLAEPKITLIRYNETDFEEIQINEASSLPEEFPPDRVTWLNIDGLHDIDLIEQTGKNFNLHPLLLEDVLDTSQRPKAETFDNMLFFVARMLSHENSNHHIAVEQVCFVLSQNFLVTFQEGLQGDVFENVRDRIRRSKGKSRKNKADYLFYELVDAIVDNYFVILEQIGNELEELESEILNNKKSNILHELHRLKNELLLVRKSIWPLRDILTKLEREDFPLIDKSTKLYIRDTIDHSIQEIETIETYRDMLTGLQDLFLSTLSNKMNEIMKLLTIITTIFIPLSFIAGVYGMNFKNMPELEWRYGYFLIIALMAVIGFGMVHFFRRKKWL
ncbi:MAG: magnesium/cobalt transporter CorA [Ignavibacteriaceae bacterium]|nr:magnesium/cobalt transporter CorA [Ignavibacteriaceae bacterium]